jgi:hypothetical protein
MLKVSPETTIQISFDVKINSNTFTAFKTIFDKMSLITDLQVGNSCSKQAL